VANIVSWWAQELIDSDFDVFSVTVCYNKQPYRSGCLRLCVNRSSSCFFEGGWISRSGWRHDYLLTSACIATLGSSVLGLSFKKVSILCTMSTSNTMQFLVLLLGKELTFEVLTLCYTKYISKIFLHYTRILIHFVYLMCRLCGGSCLWKTSCQDNP